LTRIKKKARCIDGEDGTLKLFPVKTWLQITSAFPHCAFQTLIFSLKLLLYFVNCC